MSKAYRSWRQRANAALNFCSDVENWTLIQVLAKLQHTKRGLELWAEARERGFFA